jgi:hypothetical protein
MILYHIYDSNRNNGPGLFSGGSFGTNFGRGGPPMNGGGYAHPMRPGPQPGGFPMQPGSSGGYPMQGPPPPGGAYPMPPYQAPNQFNKPPMSDPDEVFRVNAAPPSYDEVTRQAGAPTSSTSASEPASVAK